VTYAEVRGTTDRAVAKSTGAREATQRAADFLRAQLADGPVAASVIHEKATTARISKSALHRAKKQAGTVSLKQKGGWVWMLDKHKTPDNAEILKS
jgi:hypothetical protein